MAKETNQTKDNIKKKRKLLSKRRRVKLFRLIFAVVLLGLIVSAVLFIGLGVYNVGSHFVGEVQGMYQDYSDRKTARQGSPNPRFDGYTNILILGIDEGAAEGEEVVQHADTILVLSFSNETGRSRIISIPRNTWVNLGAGGGGGSGKIGNMYQMGGANLMVRQVSQLLGISIHQYIVIDMRTFADIINVLGGLDIYVEEDMNYEDPESGLSIHLQQGYQHLDGEEAQKYLRFRGEKLGDVGRVQRQQKFIKALYEKVLQLDTIPKLPALADIFQHRMETSAELFDSAHLANVLRKMSSEPPTTTMLPGLEDNNGVWEPNYAQIDAKINELFPNMDTITSENDESEEE